MRKKKEQENQSRQEWWRFGDSKIMVYTEDVKKVKGYKPFTTYIDMKTGKAIGVQFLVDVDSKEQKELFKLLGLKKKHYVKV
jgi:hypothetical protein